MPRLSGICLDGLAGVEWKARWTKGRRMGQGVPGVVIDVAYMIVDMLQIAWSSCSTNVTSWAGVVVVRRRHHHHASISQNQRKIERLYTTYVDGPARTYVVGQTRPNTSPSSPSIPLHRHSTPFTGSSFSPSSRLLAILVLAGPTSQCPLLARPQTFLVPQTPPSTHFPLCSVVTPTTMNPMARLKLRMLSRTCLAHLQTCSPSMELVPT